MIVKISKRANKKLQEFNKREWLKADKEHYRQVLDWKKIPYTLVAYERKEIVGTVGFYIEVGVSYVLGHSLLQKKNGVRESEKNSWKR
ncbi:hypothetical protein HYV22_04200 [Candidatus Gottesmanbacteria bacterium]|nr:hypothetical protein [Candidatus Gottesmanbacteria bacterium]